MKNEISKGNRKIQREAAGAVPGPGRHSLGDAVDPDSWDTRMNINIEEITRLFDGDPAMAFSRKGRKIRFYRASLQVDQALFADEVDKWWMLYTLWKEATRCQYEVTGFALLDDRLQLVLCRRDETASLDSSDQDFLIRTLGEAYLSRFAGRSSGTVDGVHEKISWEELDSPDSVVNECCRIHYLPVKEGYVENIRDFWWSSYQNYHGRYEWSFLNIAPVLGCLSKKMSTALRTFEYRQRCWENVKEEPSVPESSDNS